MAYGANKEALDLTALTTLAGGDGFVNGTAIGSPSSVVMVFVFSAIILSYIKFIEEKELEQRYGDEYVEYKKRTPFIIPRLKSG